MITIDKEKKEVTS